MDKQTTHIDNLIEGCKKLDRKSQEEFYKYFYDAMMNICMRYTKNESDAEHVLNTAFLRVFKSIQQYDPSKGALYTWIHTIVTNCCIYYLRSKQNPAVELKADDIQGLQIEPEVFIKMGSEEIINLIRGLPAATQAVFNLYVVDGYKHKDIAKLLQVSEGTSKWHLNEARKRLKHQILQKKIF